MIRTIILDEFPESDLRPQSDLNKYINLTEADIREFFLKFPERLKGIHCPGCGSFAVKTSFPRMGMNYLECSDCGTLRVSPRPEEKALIDYFDRSGAEEFWREQLARHTDEARLKKIIRPRLQWLQSQIELHAGHARRLGWLYANHPGYTRDPDFFDRFEKACFVHSQVKPGTESSKQISRIDSLDDVGEKFFDVIVLFEALDRTADVPALMRRVHDILAPGGLVFITTILSSGLDIQVLWDRSRNLIPTDRMNLFSAEGLRRLIEAYEFEIIEFSTPGVLDVEIIRQALKENPDIRLPRFLEKIIHNRDPNTLQAFQEFLQANLLSSFGRVLLRKGGS